MAKFTYALDRQTGADNKQTLCIRFANAGTRSFLTTPYKLTKADWDEKNQKISKQCSYYDADAENPKLLNYYNEVVQFITSLPGYKTMSAQEMKTRFVNRDSAGNLGFYYIMENFAQVKMDENPSSGSARSILQTMRMMQEFRGVLSLSDVTPAFLLDFESYLRIKNLKQNTIADYMTNIRSVYNYAINKGLAKRDFYPFATYKIKREKTIHRVVTIDDMQRVFAYKPENASEKLAIDLFRLSFYLIGINFKDMLYLEWKDVYNDRIVYRRMKTGRNITVRIEPEAYEIINWYRGEKRILNILDEKEKFAKEDRKSQIHTDVTKTCNKHLKRIFEKLKINIPVSTYYARHTWATTARKLGIDYDIIHLALGHSNGDVTAVYIDYDNLEIDKANRQVIDTVLKSKKKKK